MRSTLVATITLALPLLLGCCSKKEEPQQLTTTPTAANTNVKKGEVEPVGCRGMNDAASCAKCCDPKYWTASFRNGQCACIKK